MKTSILIPTISAWPQQKPTLDALCQQLRSRTDVEILLLDGNASPLCQEYGDLLKKYKQLNVLHFPGESVISLRALGVNATKGLLILITEDHCIPNKNWIENIETNLSKLNVSLIGGNVLNGSEKNGWDRANYWMTFSNYITPSSKGKFSPCIANLAFKRSFICSKQLISGQLEVLISIESQQEGRAINIGNPVHHIQSHGGKNTIAIHYHNGKSCAGLTKILLSKNQKKLKLFKILALPIWLIYVILNNTKKGSKFNKFNIFKDPPLIFALIISHTVGELLGLFYGAGNSPNKLK